MMKDKGYTKKEKKQEIDCLIERSEAAIELSVAIELSEAAI